LVLKLEALHHFGERRLLDEVVVVPEEVVEEEQLRATDEPDRLGKLFSIRKMTAAARSPTSVSPVRRKRTRSISPPTSTSSTRALSRLNPLRALNFNVGLSSSLLDGRNVQWPFMIPTS
jgi:hypothetical protein